MKTSSLTSSILALLCVTPSAFAEVICNPNTGPHVENPCEVDVESPEFVATPAPTGSPTTMMPSSPPSDTPTSQPSATPTSSSTTTPTGAPSVSPTAAPTVSPTAAPTVSTATPTVSATAAPSGIPSDTPSLAPSSSPTVAQTVLCTTEDGVFGDIDSEDVLTIEYGYELEATVSPEVIESTILPLVEKAVTNSILGDVFSQCATVRRKLRVRRRLEVTGVTQNPVDLILDDVVCGDVSDGNDCVVVSGALALYSTDPESAAALQDSIIETIRANMDAGDFNDVDEAVVRITYTDLQSNNAGAQGPDGNNNAVGGESNTPVLVGSLVAVGVLMAAILAVSYSKRKRDENDATVTEMGGEQSTMAGEIGGEQSTMAGDQSAMAEGDQSTMAEGDQSTTAGEQGTVAGDESSTNHNASS